MGDRRHAKGGIVNRGEEYKEIGGREKRVCACKKGFEELVQSRSPWIASPMAKRTTARAKCEGTVNKAIK